MLGIELYVLAEAVDLSIVVNADLHAVLRKSVPIVVLTDSLSFFNFVIGTSTITTEKRLMIEIEAIQ